MRKAISLIFIIALAAGCQSPKIAKMPPTTIGGAAAAMHAQELSDMQASLEKQLATTKQTMRELQRALDAQTTAGRQIESKLARANDDLKSSAQDLKSVRDRVDALESQLRTNQTSVAMIETRVKSTLEQIRTVETQLAGAPAKLADLQKQLEKEQRERAAAAELAKQKEKEIEALRQQLASQKRLMEESSQKTAQAKTPPPVESKHTGTGIADDATRWVTQADQLVKEGLAATAQPLYEEALKVRPSLVSALVGLAGCQYALGDADAASKTAQRALNADSKNAQAMGVLGLVYRKQGQYSSASSMLEKAVKQDPRDARLRNYFGIVLTDRQRTDEAIEQFRKACEIDGGYAEAHFNLAFLLVTARPPRLDEARQHYQKAVALGAASDPELDKLLGMGQGATK